MKLREQANPDGEDNEMFACVLFALNILSEKCYKEATEEGLFMGVIPIVTAEITEDFGKQRGSCKTIYEMLVDSKLRINFRPELVENLLKEVRDLKVIPEHTPIILIFEVLAFTWSYDVNIRNMELVLETCRLLRTAGERIVKIDACDAIFRKAMKIVVYNVIDWNEKIKGLALDCFDVNQGTEDCKTFINLFGCCVELDDVENSNRALSIMGKFFSDSNSRKCLISYAPQIVEQMQAFTYSFWPSAFGILSELSRVYDETGKIEFIFAKLAADIFDKVVSVCSILLKDGCAPLHSVDHFALDKYRFTDHGFNEDDFTVLPDIFNSRNACVRVGIGDECVCLLANSLSDTILLQFIENFCKKITESNLSAEQFVVVFDFLARLIMNCTPKRAALICSAQIFTSDATMERLFCSHNVVFYPDTLDDNVAVLRQYVISLLLNECEASIKVVLRKLLQYPLLFAEVLGRILKLIEVMPGLIGKIDMESVVMVMSVAFSLQRMKERMNVARNILFLFIQEITKRGEFFCNELFLAKYLEFLFENGVSRWILAVFQERCTTLENSKCDSVVKCLERVMWKCVDNDLSDLLLWIVEAVVYIVKVNRCLTVSFSRLNWVILTAFEKQKSVGFLSVYILDLLPLMFREMESYHINMIASFIRESCVDDVDVRAKVLMIVGIFRCGCRCESASLRCPEALLFILACYGSSPFMFEFVRMLCGETMADDRGRKWCQEGDFDAIMLRFMEHDSEEATFVHSGVLVTLRISDVCWQSVIAPFLRDMFGKCCSDQAASILIRLCGTGNRRAIRFVQQTVNRFRCASTLIQVLDRQIPERSMFASCGPGLSQEMLSWIGPICTAAKCRSATIADIMFRISSGEVEYGLYFNLYKIFEVLQNDPDIERQFFHSVICNFNVWARDDRGSRRRIMEHLSTVVVHNCRKLIKDKSVVSAVLVLDDDMMNAPESRELRNVFRRLVTRMALLSLTNDDIKAIICRLHRSLEKENGKGLMYLLIMHDVAPIILDRDMARFCANALMQLSPEKVNEEMLYIMLVTLQRLPIQLGMMFARTVFRSCSKYPGIRERAMCDIKKDASLLELCSIIAWCCDKNAESVSSICTALKNVILPSEIWSRERWFVFPLLAAYRSTGQDSLRMLDILACITKMQASGKTSSISVIVNMMTALNAALKYEDGKELRVWEFIMSLMRLYESDMTNSYRIGELMHACTMCLVFTVASDEKYEFPVENCVKPCKDPFSICQRDDVSESDPCFVMLMQCRAYTGIAIAGQVVSDLINMVRGKASDGVFKRFQEEWGNELRKCWGEFICCMTDNEVIQQLPATRKCVACRKIVLVATQYQFRGHITNKAEYDLRGLNLAQMHNVNCQLMIHGNSIDANIVISRHAVALSFAGRIVKITCDEIEYIVESKPDRFEIYTKWRVSFLVTKIRDPERKQLCALKKSPRLSAWTSTFQFILQYNILLGRSFHDKKQYPVFPAILGDFDDPEIVNLVKIGGDIVVQYDDDEMDLRMALTEESLIGPEFFCFPEGITCPLPSWAESSYELVYRLRKLLESRESAIAIAPWIISIDGPHKNSMRDMFHGSVPTRLYDATQCYQATTNKTCGMDPTKCIAMIGSMSIRYGSQIVASALSESLCSFVLALADNRVCFHIHANRKEYECKTIIHDFLCQGILITEAWGFVLLRSYTMIRVYNVNGTYIKSTSIAVPILDWATFTSADGFDYVVFRDIRNRIRAFEAFYPERYVECDQMESVTDKKGGYLRSLLKSGQWQEMAH